MLPVTRVSLLVVLAFIFGGCNAPSFVFLVKWAFGTQAKIKF
jgi:hypothetical protein